jgi:hypothetical protein
LLALGCSVAVAWGVACGLPLDGLGASVDASAGDGGIEAGDDASGSDEGEIPTGCVTLDAACLGAVPAGWQPVSVPDGGCACGACQIVGAFDCIGAVPVSGGDGCNDPTLVTVAPATCTAAQAQHVEAHPPPAIGTVGCFVPNDAGTGAVTDTLTVCVPGCTADYCGSSPRCVLAEGDVPCPTGFTLLSVAGTGADPGCGPCACDAGPPGICGGTITVYDGGSCTGGWATYPVGTCNQFSTTVNYESLIVDLVPPTASCSSTSTTPGPGDASLLGVHTICCQ